MIKRKVIIIDDDKQLVDELKEALSLNDFDVAGFSSGSAAIDVAAVIKPDVILLDLNMGGVNGFEVAKRLKRIPETAHVPIIAITGYFTKKEYDLAVELFGMKLCLKKPFKPQDAIFHIEKVLKEAESVMVSNDIRIFLVEDDEQLRQELRDVLSQEGYIVETSSNLRQASEELKNSFYNLVLVDIKLPDGSGIDLLKDVKRSNAYSAVIILTAWASIENSISALNEGAFAYIQKPFNMDSMLAIVKKALRMQKYSLDNKKLLKGLEELSITDNLTALYNYRYLFERLTKEFERAKRYTLPLSIAMLDIDYFKSINDVYGHSCGDLILKDFAGFLKDFVRGCDIVVRYGGEEFVIILPNTNKDNAAILGERLVSAIEKHTFDPDGKKIKLKISMGISSFPDDAEYINTASDFLSLADNALLSAKKTGRNRVSVYMKSDAVNSGINNADMRLYIGKIREKLILMEKSVNQTLFESVYAFAKAMYAKEGITSDYMNQMVSTVDEFSRKLGLSEKYSDDLKRAALLRDLGKVGIPDDILFKHGKVTDTEYEIIKQHPRIAIEIIKPVSFLKDLIPAIFYHHERYDGSGYCMGLAGKDIPFGARALALIDVYQALISDRPYRAAYTKNEALKIIRENAGSQFDPEIAEAFLASSQEGGENE
ncbi:MAG: diguanylate cyclase [Candidatus Omnitrophota bacterium]|nr:diguanylate cyclase [Candidatus Omnitrophota bacterium]